MAGIDTPVTVLVDPTGVFDRLARHPAWAAALGLQVMLAVCMSSIVLQKMDMTTVILEQIRSHGQEPSDEQLARAVTFYERILPVIILAPLVTVPAVSLAVALVFWLLFQPAAGNFSYRSSFAVAVHSLMPWSVAALLTVPLALARDTISAESAINGELLIANLGFIAGPDGHPLLGTILGSLDLFAVWTLLLLILGYKSVAHVRVGRTALTVLGVWASYVVGKIALAYAGLLVLLA